MFNAIFLTAAAFAFDRQIQTNNSLLVHEINASYPTNYYGVDVSQSYGASTFECLKTQNLQFAIIRCYRSVGSVDPACAGSAGAANTAGMDVHAYMFPCPKCGNAAGQVSTLLQYFVRQ